MNPSLPRSNNSIYLRGLLGLLSQIDWWLAGATIFLLIVSLSTLQHSGPGGPGFYSKQMDFIWAGLAAALVSFSVPYVFWLHRIVVPSMYAINLVLLVTVMVVGHSALGAQRWLALGPITLQPSEIAKLVVIFTLAAWLRTRPIRSFVDILKLVGIIAPPALLVFKQPDLGTSLTFGAVFLGMSFWAGAEVTDIMVLLSPALSLVFNALNIQWWYIFLGGLFTWLIVFWRRRNWSLLLRLGMALLVVAASFGAGEMREHAWGMLKEYQQKRLTSFINPYEDPRGSGYHIIQSLIAIGSGGINGTGLGRGNQAQGAFIPERHTDFIFAVIGEELGFKVTLLVIAAYAIICFRALKIAYQSRGEPGGSLVAIGIMSMFLFHVFLNIGMTMGIMPVAGVPLPFLSYGGTALIVNLVAIGLLHSIRLMNPPPKKDVWR